MSEGVVSYTISYAYDIKVMKRVEEKMNCQNLDEVMEFQKKIKLEL